MARINKELTQIIYIIVTVFLGFTAINVNRTLGLIYLSAFTLGGMFIFMWDKRRTTPLDRTGEWIKPIIQAVVLYGVFVGISYVLSPLFKQLPVEEIIGLISTTAPALSQSQILNTINYLGPIAFTETMFFVLLGDYFADKFNINIRTFNIGSIFLISVLSFLFLMFHITAKGVENNVALMMVFLMMFISLGATIYFREAKQAVFFHSIANAFGVGLFSTSGAMMLSPIILYSGYSSIKSITKSRNKKQEVKNGI